MRIDTTDMMGEEIWELNHRITLPDWHYESKAGRTYLVR
jgi:hypothetical protein